MSIRVYQLAKDLGLDSKQVMQLLHDRGLKVTSASSSIPNIYADSLVEELKISTKTKGADAEVVKAEEPVKSEERVAEVKNVAPVVPKIAHNVPKRVVQPKLDVAKKVEEPAAEPVKEVAPVQEEQKPETIEAKPEERVESHNSQAAPLPSRGAPLPGKFIKIPLPKTKTIVRKTDDVSKNLEKPAVSEMPRKEEVAVVETKPSPKEVAPVPEIVKKKPAPVNFNEKRAAPSVNFRFTTKNDRLPFNRIKLPNDVEETPQAAKELTYRAPVIVRDFAQKIGLKPFQLISVLMQRGIFASMNQQIADDVAIEIAAKYGYALKILQKADLIRQNAPKPKVEVPKDIRPRPPVVCVLGHVDHGKTTLLDTIRHTSVVAGEAGGITQHVGAYQVEVDGKKITFIDTPGHAAFSNMRERGADVTDIAILVVAADDGFMPQTDEALKFAQKAGVPVVVAINKIDAKGANIDRVKQQMQQRGIAPEDWGGDTLCVGISALKGINVSELLSLVLLQAEMMELKADYRCPAMGVIVESQIDIGRGPVATVIVQEGTLQVGDALVCNSQYCRVRSMLNERGEVVKLATPSMSVKIIGWSGVPDNGSIFETVKDEKTAKRQAEENAIASKEHKVDPAAKITNMRALFAAIESQKQKVLRVIVKCDVHGTLEALVGCLEAIKSNRVKLEILDSGVGAISKNDVEFAHSSDAMIVGFNVKMDNGVAPLVKNKGVRVLTHSIIYELIDQVKEAMAELLDYEYTEEHLGVAEVRQVFELAKAVVAGCMVTEGQIMRDKQVRVKRKNEVIFEGKINSIKRQKDDQSEVRSGFECGIRIDGFSAFEIGDEIECFDMIRSRQTL